MDHFNKANQIRSKYSTALDKRGLDSDRSAHIFEYGVIASKLILLITLLVVSFVNADVEFISEYPKEFLGEAIVVGGTTAIATAVIGLGRFASKATILNAMFIAFLVFFIFHILMEFSGMNYEESEHESNLSDEDKAKQKEKVKNVQITSYVTGIVLSLIALTMVPLALRVWDFENFGVNQYATSKYLIEMVSFGFLSGIPIYMISKNRGASDKAAWKHSGSIMGSFGLLYLGLQAGGFYSGIFGEMPSEPQMYRFAQ